ncbi:MAG TPA: hypothetical protein VH165_28715 [Kofleriaceae bacterium]|jgi:hypothetical protein|nr:hypothetical protein [Kofleriaceae bacterium]
MNLLVGFLPFASFMLVERASSTVAALVVAAATAALLVIRQRATGKQAKLLELGGLALFGGMAVVAAATHASWSVVGVRLVSDAGLFAIVAGSLVAGRPFTVDYARERVPASMWSSPTFVRTNVRLTATWAAAFAALTLADVAMLAGLPTVVGVVVSLGALGSAGFLTLRARTRR